MHHLHYSGFLCSIYQPLCLLLLWLLGVLYLISAQHVHLDFGKHLQQEAAQVKHKSSTNTSTSTSHAAPQPASAPWPILPEGRPQTANQK